MRIFNIKILKAISIILFLIILSVIFSCQNSIGVEIKRINLFNAKYIPQENIGNQEVYPKNPPSFIFYRKYYIYFFDNSSKTLYKYSRNGDKILIIQNISPTTSGFGVDKEKIMKSLDEDQRTVKINRTFPLPEVTGISVDFNDNIYLKVIIKGSSGNSIDDCAGFLSNYSDQDHKIFYLLDSEKNKDFLEKLSYFESINNFSKSNENYINFYTFYMVFNQYGDFLKIIGLSENHPSFPHNSSIFHTKEDLSEGSNKDGKKLDGTNYISFILPTIYENTGLPSALANTTSISCFIKFSLKSEYQDSQVVNLPDMVKMQEPDLNEKFNEINVDNNKEENQSTQIENQDNYQIYKFFQQLCENASIVYFYLKDVEPPEKSNHIIASEFGNPVVTPDGFAGIHVLFYEKNYLLFDSVYKIDFDKDENKLQLSYYKKLVNEKDENGVQKITLSVLDTPFGSSEGNFIFYIRYLEKIPEPTAKLIIKNIKGDQLITRIMKVKDILTTENLVVGENGSIYGFSIKKDRIYFFYYASEVALSKLKTSN
ncbi:MAG: hypothetical protein ACK4YF_05135 [Exilispira sp.]